MNKNKLKSAVSRYADFDGNEDELKEALSADEKGYSEEEVNEIIEAINNPSTGKHIVASEFVDKEDFGKKYQPGEDVSHFHPERLKHLVKRGLVSNDQ